MLWADQTNSAELLVAQMGAFKAGVSVVTFDEKDSVDALSQTLKDSGARGFLFSPQTVISNENHHTVTRQTFLQKLMPELHNLYPGDELSLKTYPHLKQIIQLGHHTIRGVIKFKDAMVYANPALSNFELPENSSSDEAFALYSNGKRASSFTSGELVSQAKNLWNNHFSKAGEQPVFISLDLETPLGLASFLANNAHKQKVYIPSSFNMTQILTSLKTQGSSIAVIDKELYELEAPSARQAEFAQMTQSVRKVIVASANRPGKSSLFSGDVATVNPHTLA